MALLLQFSDERSDRVVHEPRFETALPEVDILVVERLDAPRDDSTVVRGPTTNPGVLWNLDESVQPRLRVNVSVMYCSPWKGRPSWFERTSQGRAASSPLYGSAP